MLEEGNLIYFEPFYFPDGKSAAKNKYLIVLKSSTDKHILASLPTRTDSVPASKDGETGCLEFTTTNDGFDFVCYRIQKDLIITESTNFSFPKPTHIYGSNLKLYPNNYFDLYPYEGVDYTVIGKIKPKIFLDIIDCLKNNPSVKKGFKRILNE